MQIALTQKGQAALWVTNGCTSMSKPITTKSTLMGVDNNRCTAVGLQIIFEKEHFVNYVEKKVT